MPKSNEITIISSAIFLQLNISKIAKTKIFTKRQYLQRTMQIHACIIIFWFLIPVNFTHTVHIYMAGTSSWN